MSPPLIADSKQEGQEAKANQVASCFNDIYIQAIVHCAECSNSVSREKEKHIFGQNSDKRVLGRWERQGNAHLPAVED
eukprot:scaffold1451_cov239-Chaetoceros_neogracile.AAC.4